MYLIYPFPRRMKLGISLQTCCANFFRLSRHFTREKPFLESIFIAKQRKELIARALSFVYKTSRLVRISLLITNLKMGFFFFLWKVIFICLEFSQPLECLYQAMQTQEKSFLLLKYGFFRKKMLLLCRLQAIYL